MADRSIQAFNDFLVPAGAVAIYWFGQSSFAFKDEQGTVVLVDPYFPRERPPERFIHAEPPVDEAQVRTDYVLLTHDHRDHTCAESISRIAAAWPGARFVGPVESVRRAVEAGVDPARTQVIQAGEAASLGTMTAHAVYSKPPQGDPSAGIPAPDVTHLGYVLEAGGVRIYISGDPIHTFANLEELTSAVARLRPDVGLLTTHPTEGEFPFFDGCVRMAQAVGIKTAIPSHYQCFVKRNYDPVQWAACFEGTGIETRIIPYNTWIVYP